VIATAVGGIPEVVRDGENGLLVPPGDVGALAAAIDRVVRDDALRASLAAAAGPSVEELAEPRILGRVVQAIVADGGS
jgi:glycosyltransferase involved in cell wall biosynthesis